MNLYTLGYQDFTLETDIKKLQSAGVKRVDVREAPVSRKPGFSKRALAAALTEAGIAYTHLRMLGCPKPVRDRLKQGGSWAVYARDFTHHLEQQPRALDELIDIACAEPVSLLCFEADFKHCHRSLVADAAAARCAALEIIHLTAKTDFVELAFRPAA